MDIQEILTYELFIKPNRYDISIPVQNLIDPHFVLKGKNLYILLYEQTRGFLLKNLSIDVINAIIEQRCYIIENLNSSHKKTYPILLIPH